MNIKFSGDLPTPTSGDAVTKIEIALAVNGETPAQAVTAGRVVEITNSTEIANFLATGTTVIDTPVVQSRRVGWHTLSVDVQTANVITKIDDVTIYTSNTPTMTRTVNKIRIMCTSQNSNITPKVAYFRNLKRNGTIVDDLSGTLTSGAAEAPNWVNVLGATRGTQVFSATAPDGSTCLKFSTGDGVITNGNVQWDRYVTLEAGTWTVEVWDAGEDKTQIALQVFDATTPLSAYCGISTATTVPNGFYAGASGLTTNYYGFLSSCIPSVRLTESRSGAGAYVGAWTAGTVITPICLGAPTAITPTIGSNSIAFTWTAPFITTHTGYYVYRASVVLGVTGSYSYLGYATSNGYTDNTALDGNTYMYDVRTTDTFQEVVGALKKTINSPVTAYFYVPASDTYMVQGISVYGLTAAGTAVGFYGVGINSGVIAGKFSYGDVSASPITTNINQAAGWHKVEFRCATGELLLDDVVVNTHATIRRISALCFWNNVIASTQYIDDVTTRNFVDDFEGGVVSGRWGIISGTPTWNTSTVQKRSGSYSLAITDTTNWYVAGYTFSDY